MITEARSASGQHPATLGAPDPSVAIAVLSWSWAAVSVAATARPSGRRDAWSASRWLAAHPSDANLAARLAGQLS
jgi:hypothetical protein